MWYTTSSGKIELNITKKVAAICSHMGDCEQDVKFVLQEYPKVKRQLDKINPEVLASELKEYGAWDSDELADNEQNKVRLLWIASGDILEGRE